MYPDASGHEFYGGRDLFRPETHRKISIGYHQIVVKIKMLETDFREDRARLLSCNRSVSFADPDVLSGSWVGFFAPANTPDAIALTLNAEINRIIQLPDFLKSLAQIGFEPMVGDLPQTEAYFRTEVANWGEMVRVAVLSN